MRIFFSGIGGTAIGPLALIAKQAGYHVCGSDKQDSQYIEYLKKHGITDITIGQTTEQIAATNTAQPIDWYVYSSAIEKENPNHPELAFVREHHIHASKRDELLNKIIADKKLKLIAIAGTHGKTTTTAMTIWLFKQLRIPVSYSVGAKIGFGEMGEYDPASEYFVYECDEFDRNFLAFHPEVSLITGIDWDHPDTYPTREEYNAAFQQFFRQSKHLALWQTDADRVAPTADSVIRVLNADDEKKLEKISLPGLVNRQDALLVAEAMHSFITIRPTESLLPTMNKFPGVARRFEQIIPNLFSDYAHTPPKIRGALQVAQETNDNVVVIYEGLHNTRQHFIKNELYSLFDTVKKLYIIPSYLAREDTNLPLLSPEDLKLLLSPAAQAKTDTAALNPDLRHIIEQEIANGNLVLCLTAGGGSSLDEWLRQNFSTTSQ